MRFVNPLPLLISLGLAAASSTSWALPSDRDQPIRVQADSAELDDKQGVAVYRGSVVITQGSLKITGDTVTLTVGDGSKLTTQVVVLGNGQLGFSTSTTADSATETYTSDALIARIEPNM